MAITTTAEYKTNSGTLVSGDDTAIGSAITAAQERLERLTGRTFEQATLTEYYDGNGTESIQLRSMPVGTITSVQILNADRTVNETISSTDYVCNLRTGELRLSPAFRGRAIFTQDPAVPVDAWGTFPQFPDQFQNVKVVYQGGYASGSIPTSLKQAVWRIVDAAIRTKSLTITAQGGTGSDMTEFDKLCWEVAREWMVY